MTKDQLGDIAERAGWTAAQAALAVLATEASGIQTWWALPIATALSSAKTFIQHKLDARKKPPVAAVPEVGP